MRGFRGAVGLMIFWEILRITERHITSLFEEVSLTLGPLLSFVSPFLIHIYVHAIHSSVIISY